MYMPVFLLLNSILFSSNDVGIKTCHAYLFGKLTMAPIYIMTINFYWAMTFGNMQWWLSSICLFFSELRYMGICNDDYHSFMIFLLYFFLIEAFGTCSDENHCIYMVPSSIQNELRTFGICNNNHCSPVVTFICKFHLK